MPTLEDILRVYEGASGQANKRLAEAQDVLRERTNKVPGLEALTGAAGKVAELPGADLLVPMGLTSSALQGLIRTGLGSVRGQIAADRLAGIRAGQNFKQNMSDFMNMLTGLRRIQNEPLLMKPEYSRLKHMAEVPAETKMKNAGGYFIEEGHTPGNPWFTERINKLAGGEPGTVVVANDYYKNPQYLLRTLGHEGGHYATMGRGPYADLGQEAMDILRRHPEPWQKFVTNAAKGWYSPWWIADPREALARSIEERIAKLRGHESLYGPLGLDATSMGNKRYNDIVYDIVETMLGR